MARRGFFYVQMLGRLIAPNGYSTRRVGLDSFILLFTLSGEGVLKYAGSEYVLSPGHGCFIDCGAPHDYANESAQKWEFIFLHFNGIAAREYYRYFEALNGALFSFVDTPIPGLLEALKQQILHEDAHAELAISGTVTELLTEIIRAGSASPGPETIVPDWVKELTLYIEGHYAENPPLDLLAERFSLSKYHLSREYKRYTGLSPKEHLMNIRFRQARQLLLYSNDPVEKIALRTGFCDAANFIQQFRKREHITPLQYRRKHDMQRSQGRPDTAD